MDYAGILEQWSRIQPEKACLIEEGQVISYGEMERRAHQYAESLRSQGMSRQTVLIIRQKPADQLTAFLGAEQAGWVPVLAIRICQQKRRTSWPGCAKSDGSMTDGCGRDGRKLRCRLQTCAWES